MNYKLAKYSATGQYLGLVDAYDAHIQLCGGAYTDGRAAFTFGAQFKKSVSSTRIDLNVNANGVVHSSVSSEQMHCGIRRYTRRLSSTHVKNISESRYGIFIVFDLDLVFTQSNVERMIPASVVVYNYQTITGSTPNKNLGLPLRIVVVLRPSVRFRCGDAMGSSSSVLYYRSRIWCEYGQS